MELEDKIKAKIAMWEATKGAINEGLLNFPHKLQLGLPLKEGAGIKLIDFLLIELKDLLK
jgi:hypothetical protein